MTPIESDGLGFQVDGQHYTDMKMQPVELAYKVYGTPCFCKLAKYLTRDKGDKLTNLKKARHCIQLEYDLSTYAFMYLDSLDMLSIGDAEVLIEQFTDNQRYREALILMWQGKYTSAFDIVDKIIEEFEK